MADCMQFLSKARLNKLEVFGRFGFFKNESEPNFNFPHVPTNGLVNDALRYMNLGCFFRHTVKSPLAGYGTLYCSI